MNKTNYLIGIAVLIVWAALLCLGSVLLLGEAAEDATLADFLLWKAIGVALMVAWYKLTKWMLR